MNEGRGGLIALVVMFLLTSVTGFALVWVNIERVDQAYELKSLERLHQEKLEQNSKLQVELQYLLAPPTLRVRAKKAGLRPPTRDQIRMVE